MSDAETIARAKEEEMEETDFETVIKSLYKRDNDEVAVYLKLISKIVKAEERKADELRRIRTDLDILAKRR